LYEWLGCFTQGRTCVIVSREVALDTLKLKDFIEQNEISIIQATPSRWSQLIESGWSGKAGCLGLCGGESLTQELVKQLSALGVELWNCYGPTETTLWSMAKLVDPDDEDVQRRLSVGQGVANYQHFVLDAHGELVPRGVKGELCIASPGLARGYFNLPELTAQQFIKNPFSDDLESRLYRTGDLARYLPDGNLEFLGRRDNQVKLRGFRIELGEIESQLAAHPSVRKAVVMLSTSGEIEQLVGYVTALDDVPVDV